MQQLTASLTLSCTPVSVSLPVVPGRTSAARTVAKSKASPWRAAVLILIHLLVIAHVVQWLVTGRTVSPVEPSEAIETVKHGYVNAGFIFFVAALLGTLVLGRFFCGWGCHVVAYQDLCGWLLRKMSIRPKPFRSRLLIFVPLGAALYMFVWPQVYMWLYGIPRPPSTSHLTTAQFWKTFPGPAIAALTFAVCGFLIVYLLGNKGFCTYACPYGGFFGPIEQLALGRIRVTDACQGCGHCTSVCTSNVRVHQEVRDFGMVVDPGCMKCFDCVTVCPNDALYYGFGRPAVAKQRRTARATRSSKRYDFTWPEEVVMAVVFLATFFSFRGLYELIPFLLSLGMAVISAYLVLQAVRLLYRPNVRLHLWQLQYHGRLSPTGVCFAGIMLGWAALTAHSGLVRYHMWRGLTLFDQAEVVSGDATGANRRVNEASARSLAHLAFCDRWGLIDTEAVNMKLAWLYILRDEPAKAEHHLRRVITLAPRQAEPRYVYGDLLAEHGRFEEAVTVIRQAGRLDDRNGRAAFNLGRVYGRMGRYAEAAGAFRQAIDEGLDTAEVRYNLANALTPLGRTDEAVEHLARAVALRPDFAVAHHNLGVLLLERGEQAEGTKHLERAAESAEPAR